MCGAGDEWDRMGKTTEQESDSESVREKHINDDKLAGVIHLIKYFVNDHWIYAKFNTFI